MDMNIILDFVRFFVFALLGFLALAVSDEKYKEIDEGVKKQNFLVKFFVKKLFKPFRKIKKLIGASVDKNSVILFTGALLLLFILDFGIGAFIFLCKMIFFFIIGKEAPSGFTAAFSLLFGAGVHAFIIWLKKMKARSESEEVDKKARYQTAGQAIMLFGSFLMWLAFEIAILLLSPRLAYEEGTFVPSIFFKVVMVAMAVFAVIFAILLLKYGIEQKGLKIMIALFYLPIFFGIAIAMVYFTLFRG